MMLKHYMTGITFKLDIISILPLDLFYLSPGVGPNVLLRLPRIFKVQYARINSNNYHTVILQFFKLVFMLQRFIQQLGQFCEKCIYIKVSTYYV